MSSLPTMVIPNWYPRESRVTQQEVLVGTICRNALPVIVQGENGSVGQGNPVNTLSIPIIAIGIFIDVIAQMNDVVDGVFSCRISERIEETKWKIRTRVDGKFYCGRCVSGGRDGLGTSNRAGDIGAADIELVVVRSEGF